jgi:flavin reductase (DIM6/NTAB) family NADH-FMN oxidoreductase RutF
MPATRCITRTLADNSSSSILSRSSLLRQACPSSLKHAHIGPPVSGFQSFRRFTSSPTTSEQNVSTDSTHRAAALRQLMRDVAYPVAIVTATPHPTASSEPSDPHHWRGATISSFTTVALEPVPVVSFNVRHDSSTFEALKASGKFNVHLMGCTDRARTLAKDFARGLGSQPFYGKTHGSLRAMFAQPTAGDEIAHPTILPQSGTYVERTLRTPSRKSSGGFANLYHHQETVLFQLNCTFLPDKTVEIGDHVVVFGEVRGIDGVEDGDVDRHATVPCLLYVHGHFSDFGRLHTSQCEACESFRLGRGELVHPAVKHLPPPA